MTETTEKRRYSDLMLDLETMSQSPRAAIIQIGAVMFDPVAREVAPDDPGYRFTKNVSLKSSVRYGGEVSEQTKKWWAGQDYEVRMKLIKPSVETLPAALAQFNHFWRLNKPTRVWSNGASFDVPIMEHAYQLCTDSFEVSPWAYWNIRDYRTPIWMAGLPKANSEMRHNALADALAQAEHLCKAFTCIHTSGLDNMDKVGRS